MKSSVVVIGGGITGVLSALELARAGHRVTLLEAKHLGAGSSSRTAAGIRQQFSTFENVVAMRHSVDYYQKLAAQLEQKVVQQNGYLFLFDHAERWNQAKERIRLQQNAGLHEVEAIAKTELSARFPYLNVSDLQGATWCPSDGFLFPAVIYGEGARLAAEAGVQIIQNAPVLSATHNAMGISTVTTPKGSFSADFYIDCTNAWSQRTAELLGGTTLAIAPLKRYLWFVQKNQVFDPSLFQQWPLIVCPNGVYGRPENSSSLMLGWALPTKEEHHFTYEDQDEIFPGYSHNSGIDAVPFEAWATFAHCVPSVGEFDGIYATTSGYYGSTPDHNPFLGFDLQQKNLIRTVGFSGHGAMFGPFSAHVACALVAQQAPLTHITVGERLVSLATFSLERNFDMAESLVI